MGKAENLRIVVEKRGELTTGFRVQRMSYVRHPLNSEYGPKWCNTGRKCYSSQEAKDYYDHLLKHTRQFEPVEYEVILHDSHTPNYSLD